MPRDPDMRQYEVREQRADHFAHVHLVGCANCGFAIDITVAVMRHADAVLSILYHLAGEATAEELKSAIASMRGWNDEIVTWQLLEDAEFIELKELWDRVMEQKEAARGSAKTAKKRAT